ncbi:MAG TPA: SAM-dependent methyltransferase [Spirochaetia bacterium]|nr:SAM-dependent methyltransferase [Spirochaetia bacterium]
MEQAVPPISDANTPSAGRIYDFFLGGRHNFEVDRIAAKGLLKDVPEMPQWVRLIRWFLGAAVRRLSDDGFTKFLDFASGLPTVDHIHQITPKGTRVIYSDIDPITVAYAQEIVKDLPDVAYVHGDAGRPESVLELPIIEQLFGSDRKLAIGLNGIAWFLPDEKVRHALGVLYEWVAPGSKLFICDTNYFGQSDEQEKVQSFYKDVKEPVHPRTEAEFRQLFGEWRPCDPGIQRIEKWLPINTASIDEAVKVGGVTLVGAILEKV